MRFFTYILAVTVAVPVLLPGSATAQSDVSGYADHNKKRLNGFDDLLFQNSERAGLNVVALCLAERRPARAIDTLSYGFMSEEQMTSLGKFFKRFLNDSSCNLTRYVESEAPSVPIIGGLAEFFLLRKYRSEDLQALDQLTQSDWQTDAMLPRNSNEFFGQCVVQANRAAVFDLVNTIPGTELEAGSIKELVPLLDPCVADGQEASFDKTALRAMLAFSLYRAVSQGRKTMDASE